jgi:hypothetical protein
MMVGGVLWRGSSVGVMVCRGIASAIAAAVRVGSKVGVAVGSRVSVGTGEDAGMAVLVTGMDAATCATGAQADAKAENIRMNKIVNDFMGIPPEQQ